MSVQRLQEEVMALLSSSRHVLCCWRGAGEFMTTRNDVYSHYLAIPFLILSAANLSCPIMACHVVFRLLTGMVDGNFSLGIVSPKY